MSILLICCQNAEPDQPYQLNEETLQAGERLFKRHCASCHGIKEGVIGPPLGGITEIFAPEVLIDLIKEPEKVMGEMALRSKILQKKYSSVMPVFYELEKELIVNVFAYVHHQSQVQDVKPLIVDTTSFAQLILQPAPPVQQSTICLKLEDQLTFPHQPEQPPDKGLATLRSHPAILGALLISDQMGKIYLVEGRKKSLFLDLEAIVPDFIFSPGIGTGLGSFDLHPGFLQNGLIYTTHAEKYLGKPALNDGDFPDSIGVGLQWVLSEWQVASDLRYARNDRREVLRLNTPTTAHGVQDISFVPDLPPQDADYGNLYLGVGDGGCNNIRMPELADTKFSLLGSILRIDPRGKNGRNGRYGIPSGNPFLEDEDKSVYKELWAYGFRNPHRICWDRLQGNRMIVADIGEANVEEINIVERGRHYGWSHLEGNMGVDTKKDKKVVFEVSNHIRRQYHPPLGQFSHRDGKAISGGFVYQGELKDLKGKYIFGDIVTGKVFYMHMDAELQDSTIYELSIHDQGSLTTFAEITGSTRVHLRIGYDRFAGDLFFMTKGDATLRKVIDTYVTNELWTPP
ncbi:MAG: c-type cytochrome [Saprospiraceae bacterium]|nr:c-type cytochrome [Saprospiraceae bacterium]